LPGGGNNKSPAVKMDYKIRAFGACMIGGFPHRYEDSCFHLAVERLRLETRHNLIPSIYTMGGFPVTRVPKHLQSRCLDAAPDMVVLQFGSSDLVVPVRKRNRHQPLSASVERKVSATPATAAHQLRWRLRGILGSLLQLTPVTPPDIYLETMGQMVRTIAAANVVPVVLSPFVFGSSNSDRVARACVPRLQSAVAAVPGAHYVEVYSALDKFPRRQMLLGDGTHLSLQGQAVVGECLFAALAKIIRD
jgi:lysophospholipase L1-like esterase